MNSQNLTGYPSIDRPWLKYYSEEAINAPLPHMSMYDYLWECNKDYLDNIALNYFGRKITYRKMFENIDKVAVALQANGVKKGDIVSVCTLTAPETVYLIYAINKVGAVSNWLGLTSPVQDLHEQIDSTDSRLVFAVETAYDLIVEAAKDTKVEKIVSIPIEFSMPSAMRAVAYLKQKHPKLNSNSGKWKDFLAKGNCEFMDVEIDNEEMAVIEYTGGTTGVPKGVMISNYAGNAYASNYIVTENIISVNKGDSFLNILPPFIALGIFAGTHMPLCHTGNVILIPDPSPSRMSKHLLRYKPNHILGGVLHFNNIVENQAIQKSGLKFVKTAIYGGETATKEWEVNTRKYIQSLGGVGLQNGYGMTEVTSGIINTPFASQDMFIPFPNVIIKIVDIETGYEKSYDEIGEIYISTPTAMLGYYRNKSETDNVLCEINDMLWIKTADLGFVSKNGNITITGRKKRIYHKIVNNIHIRVYPMRIEEELCKSEYVYRCAVIGKKDYNVAYRSIAFIILKGNSTDTERAKSAFDKLCRKNLPESHVPDEYRFVECFPLTRAGKVDYRALEEMANEELNNT